MSRWNRAGCIGNTVFDLLEGSFGVVLANAHHIKAVHGRKTDVKDCEWLADLLAHGSIRASFIPPASIRELRDLTRHRKSLIRDRVKTTNRVHKLLEGANTRQRRQRCPRGIWSGDAQCVGRRRDGPRPLGRLARGRLTPKVKQLAEALRGRFSAHHGFLLGQILTQLDQPAVLITSCDARITDIAHPFEAQIQRLQTVVGIGRRSAEVVVSEIGVDMPRFATSAHLASWARICPGTHESAGKRRSAGTGTGNNWLRTTLLESAWAASHSRDSYLETQYRRISKRRGPKRADHRRRAQNSGDCVLHPA